MQKLLFSIVIAGVLSSLLFACKKPTNLPEPRPNWHVLTTLESKNAAFDIKVKLKKAYQLGDSITLSLSSAKDGKLWIIYVDPQDDVSLLYPNHYAQDNQVKAAMPLKIPADEKWIMRAIEPSGKSLLAFIVTTGDAPANAAFDKLQTKNIADLLQIFNASSQWSISVHLIEVTK